MGKLFAQEFFLVGRKVGYQDLAARRHDARRFRHGMLRIVQVMQHLVEQYDIKAACGRAIGKRQTIGVAQPDLRVLDIAAQQPVAGDGQHVGADIDADGAARMGRDQLQHAPGTGARI